MIRSVPAIILTFALLAFWNCASPEGTSEDSETAGETAAPVLAPTKEATIRIEGTDERITLKLFDSRGLGFPEEFATYYPEDFVVETFSSPDGDAVRFVAAFGGKSNDDASVQIFFFGYEVDEEAASAAARHVAESHGLPDRPSGSKRFPWSIVEYEIDYQDEDPTDRFSGLVALGKQNDSFFYAIIHHPAEYAEGLGPRADFIFSEWTWIDTGRRLEP